MSAYTTIDITRGKALELYVKHHLGEVSDSNLESFMDELMQPALYRCSVVNNDQPNYDYLAG